MKPNVGMIDTLARFILGAGGIIFAFNGHSAYWYVFGFLIMLSGIIRYCPAYTILGLSTCEDAE